MSDIQVIGVFIGVYLLGYIIALVILNHPDWKKPLESEFPGRDQDLVAQVLAAWSWIAVATCSKWIYKEIVHQIKMIWKRNKR